jgi:F-type H+-transporting ATPase subunit a
VSESKKRWRYGFKRWLIIGLTIIGAYCAFIGPSILKPISPVVVLPGEPTGLSIGGFEITNTVLATLLADLILILIALGVWRFHAKGKLVPTGFYNFFEIIVEFLWNSVAGAAGKWSKRIFPLVATIFLIIFVANMVKMVPGFESIGYLKEVHKGTGYGPVELATIGGLTIYTIDKGQPHSAVAAEVESAEHGEESGEMCTACEVVPYLRGSATDVNFTFGLAIVAVVMTQVYGVWAARGMGYFEKFFPVKQLVSGSPFGIIAFGVGFLEIILEFAKILSFGFRLFGNIFAGALLLSIVGALVAIIIPPGLYLFELFFGVIQAYVFFLLATMFISGATVSHHGSEHH